MKLRFRKLQQAGCIAVLLVATALLSGCSGISATKSISPLDFLLPGLLKNDSPAVPGIYPAQIALSPVDHVNLKSDQIDPDVASLTFE